MTGKRAFLAKVPVLLLLILTCAIFLMSMRTEVRAVDDPCLSNPPPTAHGQHVIGSTEDSSVQITLSGSDQELETLTYEVVSGPSHGTLTGTTPALTYNWDGGGAVADSFTFRVNDGCHNSPTVTVNVEMVTDIANSNAPAVAHRKFYNAPAGSVACTLSGSDFDEDTFNYDVVEGPSYGTLSGTTPNLTYNRTDPDFFTDVFYYNCFDGRTDIPRNSTAVSVYIHIGALNTENLPPICDAGPAPANVKTGVTRTLDGSYCTDPLGRSLSYEWSCSGGSLSDNSAVKPVWTAPAAAGTVTCNLTATNSDNVSSSDSYDVTVEEKEIAPAYDLISMLLLAGFCAFIGVRYVRRGARENGQDKTCRTGSSRIPPGPRVTGGPPCGGGMEERRR